MLFGYRWISEAICGRTPLRTSPGEPYRLHRQRHRQSLHATAMLVHALGITLYVTNLLLACQHSHLLSVELQLSLIHTHLVVSGHVFRELVYPFGEQRVL